jgi:hypothetical protein
MARSELLISLVLVSGCDVVIGLSGDQHACGTTTFKDKGTAIVAADDFSIDWDATFAVLSTSGLASEYRFADRSQTAIDLGGYDNLGLALAPEGNGLFFTASIEPPTLMAAGLEKDAWRIGQRVPKGDYAGTPSADTFGPRRSLVRVDSFAQTVQEFEDQDGVWVAVGDPHGVPGFVAPNLTPNGLTMVYADNVGSTGVFLATRASMDTWFGPPVLVLAGDHRFPQLLGRCSDLYVIDDGTVTRYQR